ncbi:tryptophan halogenase family protein [Bowmanella sp. JS7-9]|uniref:Tryptophan halogenase family protein n=1 Tax=Pseudobowmanella zhangzhouensis TaxID=1537679 RepID=A0ABW1XLV6_9ALTE|nr:tryptophan halogenase family protein [Bowmanella sp. JS7-9]TBX20396.1 tryptophan halogenase [Bowmanella sp. JS7-9]
MRVQAVQKVIILGGGTAGWITASLMAKVLGKVVSIELIESDQIGTVGVGEATIPPIQNFNAALGIQESEFLRATKGTIKLGIQFENWWKQNSQYMHAFGNIGKNFPFCDFHHFWRRAQDLGIEQDYWDFSLNYQAAINNKFAPVQQIEGTNLPGIAYAYHFDAGLYAQFLRDWSIQRGVVRTEGTVAKVNVDEATGNIRSLQLQDGNEKSADLFVDCTGLRALLIEQTLNTGYEDWSHWLPCDSAWAVPCERTEPLVPYTRSIAHEAGWQWRIPLTHRTGNGIVFSSKFCDPEQAKATLLANLDGAPLNEPRLIQFKTGRRRKQWHKNVVAIGLSSGFLEPLESTSIHLIQSCATRLIKCFPHEGIRQQEVDEFNRQSALEIERIRDFIILHYKANERGDTDFWRYCQQMDIPDTLARKIDLFKSTGKVFRDYDDLFTEAAWQQVLIGQGVTPQDYMSIADSLSREQLQDLFDSLKTLINRTVDKLPPHDAYLPR